MTTLDNINITIWQIMLLVTAIGFVIESWIKAWKCQPNLIEKIIEYIIDLAKYFIAEHTGKTEHKLNTGMVYFVIICCFSFLGLVVYHSVKTSKLNYEFLVCLCFSLVILFLLVVFCSKFTRHRI